MTVGPLVVRGRRCSCCAGSGRTRRWLADVLPAVLVFGAGLALTVAPLTATVLAAAARPARRRRRPG